MSLRLLQISLHHSKAASAALLLRLTEGGADLVLVQEPWVVGGKVAGLGTKEYKLMLDPKEGKIRTCILPTLRVTGIKRSCNRHRKRTNKIWGQTRLRNL